MFIGSMTAIVTPFRGGKIDEAALRKLIDRQIENGTDGLVPCGTTGEAATLSLEERDRVVRITVEQTGHRVPVIAGAGSNDTSIAIKLARLVKEAGADGQLQVTPYYNKPPPAGLFRHFEAIAKAVDLPMILYNVPSRTGINMLPETTIRLSAIDIIVGIKEAAGNLEQVRTIVEATGPDFAVISGEDSLNLKIYQAGGKGCISVTANVAPNLVAKVWDTFCTGNLTEAEQQQNQLAELNRAMFLETNPIPVKTALALMNLCEEEFRLPLVPMSPEPKKELSRILEKYGLV